MSIVPSNLAGGFAQGTYQAAQSAKAGDSQRAEAARNAQRMRELLQKHMESVEDSYESSDGHMTVDKDGQGSSQAGYYDPFPHERREDHAEHTAHAETDDAPPLSPGHLDVTA